MFKKTEAQIAMIRTLTSVNERESYMKGRIEAHHIPAIVKSRGETSFIAKIPSIASRAGNSDYLLNRNDYVEDCMAWILREENKQFERAGCVINDRLQYLCCCPDGNVCFFLFIIFIIAFFFSRHHE